MILTFALSSPGFTQCTDTCNIYSFTYAEKSYEFIKELKNREEAAQCAVERDGYLTYCRPLSACNLYSEKA